MRHIDDRLADTEPDPMLLFHYTRDHTLAKILDTGQLRLSPYAVTNDPRETKEWVARVVWAAGGVTADILLEADEAASMADVILRRGARLACLTLDRTAEPDAEAGSLFHRGWARARMWSQYANEHAGACLVFQRELLIEQIDSHRPLSDGDLFSYGTVKYADTSLRIPMDLVDVRTRGALAVLDDYQVRKGIAGELYFTKNRDWSSEEEFRIVVVRWNLPEPELDDPLDIPFGASLRAIVLGDCFSDAGIRDLRHQVTRYPDVKLLRCAWEAGAPVLRSIT